MLTSIRETLRNLRYIHATGGSVALMWFYATHKASDERHVRAYLPLRDSAMSQARQLDFSNDWFSGNIPYWAATFETHGLHSRSEVQALEIGSWEGRSSHFLLEHLPHARLTCVDTWQGADEHKALKAANRDTLSKVESTFDRNLSAHAARVTKFRGSSLSYFEADRRSKVYDLIYVDGSHHADDVVTDAIQSFRLLKVGGLLIFDDYFWGYYRHTRNNPATAINGFLRLKRGAYRIVRFYYQIIIEKTADDSDDV